MDMVEKMRIDQDDLRNLIFNRANLFGLSSESIKPIPDGVYDIDEYYNSTPRIMWILKEPYDDLDATGNPIGGGWILNDAFDNEDAWKNKTWQPIIYIAHGIKNCRHWNDMDWIHDDKSMVDRLKEIAYINLSKMPNRTESNDDFVFEATSCLLSMGTNVIQPIKVILNLSVTCPQNKRILRLSNGKNGGRIARLN